MNKLICSVGLSTTLLFIGGCATRVNTVAVDNVVYQPAYRVAYTPGYQTDYIYSVGYYNNRPYWGNNYYYYNTGYAWGTPYWGSGFYNGF